MAGVAAFWGASIASKGRKVSGLVSGNGGNMTPASEEALTLVVQIIFAATVS